MRHEDVEPLHQLYLKVNRDSRRRWGQAPLYPWGMETGLDNENFNRYIEGMKRGDPRYHIYVAVDKEGAIVGYTRAIHRADKDFTTYHTLLIREDYRGSGLFDRLTVPVIAGSAAQGKCAINFSVNSLGAVKHYQKQWHAEETSRSEKKYAGTLVYMHFDPNKVIKQREREGKWTSFVSDAPTASKAKSR